VAADFARRGISVAASRIVLTASTSDAYSVLFKLLCESSSDEVLVPAPSYPLFDHLTRLDGVGIRRYELAYHGRWEVDEGSVERSWTDAARALLAVSPNNPTGSLLTASELRSLSERCAAREAALIIDEVFADYTFVQHPRDDSRRSPAVTFRLGGLSKSAGLPQVKLGWIAVEGPDAWVEEALERLSFILDTYLSVSTPVQIAAPALIARGAEVRRAIQQRLEHNLRVLREAVTPVPSVELLPVDGGWSAVVRVPARRPEEEIVLGLLDTHDTLVHPGFFFDFAHEAFLVISLLPEPSQFEAGVTRMLEFVDA
jgi:aspartate/methionine/tyrosine aminotransferase